jgi:hypothetical protein
MGPNYRTDHCESIQKAKGHESVDMRFTSEPAAGDFRIPPGRVLDLLDYYLSISEKWSRARVRFQCESEQFDIKSEPGFRENGRR